MARSGHVQGFGFRTSTKAGAPQPCFPYRDMMSRILSLMLLAILGLANIWIDYSFVEDIRKVLEKRPLPFSHYSTSLVLGYYAHRPDRAIADHDWDF